MTKEKSYDEKELMFFDKLINQRLSRAYQDLNILKEDITEYGNHKVKKDLESLAEDSKNFEEKKKLNILCERQNKYIVHLEKALERVKKGDYGICMITGKKIDKKRLTAVPHTRQSIFAKKSRRD